MAQKPLRTPDVNIVRNETKFSEGHLTSVRVLCMGHCWLETLVRGSMITSWLECDLNQP